MGLKGLSPPTDGLRYSPTLYESIRTKKNSSSLDGTDRSTRVNVHQAFQGGTDTTHLRLLLFSHSKQVARVRVQDGRVVDVQLEDA